MNRKPIIGVVLKHLKKPEKRPNMFIRDEIKQAIFDNGGIAIGITLPKDEVYDVSDSWTNNLNNEEYENLVTQINLCDGIIIQGGSACDNYEMIVAKYCYDNDIPILGICCGQNVLVRAVGGTTKLVENPTKHFAPSLTYVHTVNVLKDTKLFDVLKKEKINVNSRHKKTIATHPNLIVNCMCDDGYIDGVEAPDKKFYIGFRFHPESLYKIDNDHNNIFKYFISKCSSSN